MMSKDVERKFVSLMEEKGFRVDSRVICDGEKAAGKIVTPEDGEPVNIFGSIAVHIHHDNIGQPGWNYLETVRRCVDENGLSDDIMVYRGHISEKYW